MTRFAALGCLPVRLHRRLPAIVAKGCAWLPGWPLSEGDVWKLLTTGGYSRSLAL